MSDHQKWIIGAEDIPAEAIDIPEWPHRDKDGKIKVVDGQPVCRYWIQTLAFDELKAFTVLMKSGSLEDQIHTMNCIIDLGARTLVDAEYHGKRIFPESDVALFASRPKEILVRIFNVAQKVNGFDAEAPGAKNS